MNMNPQVVFAAPFGKIGIRCAEGALLGIEFLPMDIRILPPRNLPEGEVCRQLQAYFADANFQFDLPLSLHGTAHQRKVWQAMCEIPRGEMRTYGNLAAALRSSPRAVGQACGNNPIPIIVPCHRVVSKAGLGGFMHRADDGALDIKRWLLAHERVTPSPASGRDERDEQR